MLSRRRSLLSTLEVEVFDVLKEQYKADPQFGRVWAECSGGSSNKFLLQDGFLFEENQLCIPQGSLRFSIIKDAHGGGLAGHFGCDKTLALMKSIGRGWIGMLLDTWSGVGFVTWLNPKLKIRDYTLHYQFKQSRGKM